MLEAALLKAGQSLIETEAAEDEADNQGDDAVVDENADGDDEDQY
jgi:hypothetical protein